MAERKTETMLALEATHGKPVEQLLIERYEEHGTHQAVAISLGISREAICTWLTRLGATRRETVRVSFPHLDNANSNGNG